MLETFVAQNLVSILHSTWPRANLFFWNIQGRHEVDFIIEAGNRCLAIEVKAAERWAQGDLAGLKAFVVWPEFLPITVLRRFVWGRSCGRFLYRCFFRNMVEGEPPMKILYDHQIFDLQQYGGISRYFYELMRAYAAAGEPGFELSCPFTTNAYLWEAPFLQLNTPLTRRRYKGSGVVNRLLAERGNRPAAVAKLAGGDYDLFHPTYYDPYFLGHLGEKPFVLTVHDMIHERYPECFPPDDPTTAWKRLLAERAAHIIADSHSTKSDLLEFCRVPADKVTVVHLGCSLQSPAAGAVLSQLPARYLLYVGERSRYKNFTFAVRALAPLFRAQPDLMLVSVGGGPFSAEELALFAESGLAGRCLQISLPDRELAAAYSGALALVFPSLCEGFGIPVLEAFACGCPALLAGRSSLPEVGGDAALYFDPENGAQLLGQTERLLADPALRGALVQSGRERVREFTWERTAEGTRAVYTGVLGGKGCL